MAAPGTDSPAKDSKTSNVEANTEGTEDGPADFETAMKVSGFGKFNVLLLLVSLPANFAAVFETSVVSYILPSAECDLKLTLFDKGLLNAITYAGMITSPLIWGYIADTKGRKMLLVWGYLTNVICVIGASTSQNVVQLMVFKYLGGFVLCGPFAVFMSYMTELHGKDYRGRVMMSSGMMFAAASLTLPLLALGILPNQWDFNVFGLGFHSWQVFLAVSAIPSLLSGSLLSLFPESPRFLMSQGRNEEALEAFKMIYSINKHKPRETYPIRRLVEEVPHKSKQVPTVATIEEIKPKPSIESDKCKKTSFRNGLMQMRPLFTKPHLGLSLRVYLINFCLLLGQNTMRLWLPQLFASSVEYEQISKGDTSMCDILEYSVYKTAVVTNATATTCEVVITGASYTNNIVVALAGIIGYAVAVPLVNLIGVKRILIIALFAAGTCAAGLYWSSSSLNTLAIVSVLVTTGSISSTSVISASVDIFPTSLRTMVVSMVMMMGRSGSLLGNVLFPMFMSLGCIPPFLMISSVMFFASLLSAYLPNAKKTELK